MTSLSSIAPEIADLIARDRERQLCEINLIASENYLDDAILEVQGSVLSNVYADADLGLGHDPGRHEFCRQVEELALNWARQLFGAEHVNVQLHSGTQANMAVMFAMLKPGDTLMGMDENHGGHTSHGNKGSFSDSLYRTILYRLDPKTGLLNYDDILELAKIHHPKLIIAGASAYPRQIDFKAFRRIADQVGAYVLADIAHTAGLVAANLNPNPVPYADFVTFTTHKTLGGAHGGVLMCRKIYADRIDSMVSPGIQGGCLMQQVAAKAITFRQALTQQFKEYQAQVLKNARILAEDLIRLDYTLVSGGTDTHLMLVDLSQSPVSGCQAARILYEAGIIVNAYPIPFRTSGTLGKPGLRLGTPAVTRRGMKETEMRTIAQIIHRLLAAKGDSQVCAAERKKVIELCQLFSASPVPRQG